MRLAPRYARARWIAGINPYGGRNGIEKGIRSRQPNNDRGAGTKHLVCRRAGWPTGSARDKEIGRLADPRSFVRAHYRWRCAAG